MMEGNNNKEGMCGCDMGHHGHKGWRIAMKLFYLIVLIAVFCFGMQLGELRTLSREFNHSRMMGSGYNNFGAGAINRQMGTSTRNQ